MEEEEKPKKKFSFPGMKKKPKFGQPRKPPMKYRDLKPFDGKPKPGLSQHQLKTFDKFMARKPGETKEQWDKRTRSRRVIREDEIDTLPKNSRLRVQKIKKIQKEIEYKNRCVVSTTVDKDFDFLKYYGIIMRFFSIKYDIKKVDLEVGFYFYENLPFTKERFENICVMVTGCSTGKFNYFRRMGYVKEIVKQQKTRTKTVDLKTNLFKLSRGFVHQITEVYSILGRMKELRMGQKTVTPYAQELRDVLFEMNEEIMDIQLGRKNSESI